MSFPARQSSALSFRAAIFDMDGVVTRTAELHAAAWKAMFDQYLQERIARGAPGFRPFDASADYLEYVDGKPRHEGVRSFLAARGITLPVGSADDSAEADTIRALGKRKDALFEQAMHRDGVHVFPSTLNLIKALRADSVKTAVVTSSRHGREVLHDAGIESLFDVVVDGVDAVDLALKGKPDPATFLNAAEQLGVAALDAIVVEDATSGVLAGRHGGFGLVIGVDRGGNRNALMRSGADVVVADLGELDIDHLEQRFRQRATERQGASATIEDAWWVEQEGFEASREHEMESLFTVGNGYLGVRGALDMPLPGSQADLFIAGIYDRKQSKLPYSELEFLTEGRQDYAYSELVSFPFPFRIRLTIDGRVLDMVKGPWRSLRRLLDLRRGSIALHYLFEDEEGRRTTVETWRAASAADTHLLMQEVMVTCENYDGFVEIDTSLHDPEIERNHPHLQPLLPEIGDGLDMRMYATQASNYQIAIVSRARFKHESEDHVYAQTRCKAGGTVCLHRIAAVYTSRDGGEPLQRARTHVESLRWEDFHRWREAHETCWSSYWDVGDMVIDGSAPTTQALRFDAYHLRIAAADDPRTSIGARTLSGRAYEGHIFWDVEVFILPYFIHTYPNLARSLLLYRFHTLDGARQRAVELGYRGACYAWESTVTGVDTTPQRIILRTSGKEIPIYTGREQIHVTADVAYGVWRYLEATDDTTFLAEAGAEILFETARFWASRCVSEGDGYHINDVTGPDEYHHTVNDNAYTNWMARFNLEKAVWATEQLRKHQPERWQALCAVLSLEPDEPSQWQTVAQGLYCPEPSDEKPIEQFKGYFDRQEYRLKASERFNPPIRRLFEAEKINRSKLIKQADVLMLPYLFPERFSQKALAVNYDYYEPRTDHASSLSPAVHAMLAARLGRSGDARRYWRQSLWLDLSNTMGNSTLGVHAACMAGNWYTLVFGFLGVRFNAQGPVIDVPATAYVPAHWRSVALSLRYRGKTYPVNWERKEEKP